MWVAQETYQLFLLHPVFLLDTVYRSLFGPLIFFAPVYIIQYLLIT